MQTEALAGGVPDRYEVKTAVQESSKKAVQESSTKAVQESSTKAVQKSSKMVVRMERVEKNAEDMEITPIHNEMQNVPDSKPEKKPELQIPEKEPSKSSIDAAMSLLNSQIEKTHCAYSYDEETKRISIKVFDDETDELIREVPPEKSLEALKKIWEIAGIIIDEKR